MLTFTFFFFVQNILQESHQDGDNTPKETDEPRIKYVFPPDAPPPKDLICPICQDVLKNPIVYQKCKHTYCRSCLSKKLREKTAFCPICNEEFQKVGGYLQLITYNPNQSCFAKSQFLYYFFFCRNCRCTISPQICTTVCKTCWL